MCMCIDYNELNKVTVKNKYPLPQMDDIFNQLKNASVFSKIDKRLGYYQVQMIEQDILKTVFQTKYRQYKFMVIAFRLINTLIVFIDLMNKVLQDCLDSFIMMFINDILV